MGLWIAAGIAVAIALATVALVWARDQRGGLRGIGLSAAASWLVAAIAGMSLFARADELIGYSVSAGASVLGLALIGLALWRRRSGITISS